MNKITNPKNDITHTHKRYKIAAERGRARIWQSSWMPLGIAPTIKAAMEASQIPKSKYGLSSARPSCSRTLAT